MDVLENLQKVEMLLKSHRTDEAGHLIENLRRAEPQNCEVHYWSAVCAKMNGNLEKAENDFLSVVKSDPKHYKAFYGLGLVLEGKGNIPDAVKAYQEAISINPSHQQTLQKLAEHHIQAPSQAGQEKITEKLSGDYKRLAALLKAGKWKKADKETAKCFIKLSGHKNIRLEDIGKFPCEKLSVIDGLWMKHSKGRFGFSVQKKIYQGVGGLIAPEGYDATTFEWFIKRIAWYTTKKTAFRRVGGALFGSKNLSYHLAAPPGHLPGTWILPRKNTLCDQKKDGLFGLILTYIMYLIAAVFFFGLICGLLIQDESGFIIGGIVGLALSFQIPLGAMKKTRERKRSMMVQKKMVMIFNRLQNCGL